MALKPLRVLVFSVSIGAGHDSVANALIQEIKEQSPDSEVMIVDTFKYINPILNKVVVGSYIETLRFTPKVWGYLYDHVEDGERLVDMGQILSKLLSPKLEQLLTDFEPDVLICTHAFPVGILSVLKGRRNLKLPLIACITDYNVHNFWIHSEVDMYVIPCKDLRHVFLEEKIPLEKIKAFGIPIRPQFLTKPNQWHSRKKLGLNSMQTVLVVGGGWGLGKIEVVVSNLLEQSELQILVITGSNEKLKRNLEMLKPNTRLHVFGFVDNVAELMAASDVIVTKPGGITCAETLAMELPMIIISPLPGQEDRNTDYFTNKGVAIRVRKIEHLQRELTTLCENGLRLRHMQEMAAYLKKPKAASQTIEAIWGLVKKEDGEETNAHRIN